MSADHAYRQFQKMDEGTREAMQKATEQLTFTTDAPSSAEEAQIRATLALAMAQLATAAAIRGAMAATFVTSQTAEDGNKALVSAIESLEAVINRGTP